jgi:hypothetical protein
LASGAVVAITLVAESVSVVDVVVVLGGVELLKTDALVPEEARIVVSKFADPISDFTLSMAASAFTSPNLGAGVALGCPSFTSELTAVSGVAATTDFAPTASGLTMASAGAVVLSIASDFILPRSCSVEEDPLSAFTAPTLAIALVTAWISIVAVVTGARVSKEPLSDVVVAASAVALLSDFPSDLTAPT